VTPFGPRQQPAAQHAQRPTDALDLFNPGEALVGFDEDERMSLRPGPRRQFRRSPFPPQPLIADNAAQRIADGFPDIALDGLKFSRSHI
jgi:hypothetical protein